MTAKYVYIDNSNVWIEGMKLAAVLHGKAVDLWDAGANNIYDRDWKYDFGKLLELVGGKKNGLKRAVLFGSRPPQNDSLWAAAKQSGFEVFVEDRNIRNKEKKVDTGLAVKIIEDSFVLIKDTQQDEVIIVAGDADYVPVVKSLIRRGIRVVVCFWSHAAQELQDTASEFLSLDDHLDAISR